MSKTQQGGHSTYVYRVWALQNMPYGSVKIRVRALSNLGGRCVNLYNVKSPLSLVERSIFGTVAKLTIIMTEIIRALR